MGGNEYLMAASTFHSLHAISKQLAPVKSGGITTVEAPTFVLHCFESPTGVKFFVTARPRTADVGVFLRRVYEMYADYVLKVRRALAVGAPRPARLARTPTRSLTRPPHTPAQNPFYELEMPIRVKLFDESLANYVRSAGLGNIAAAAAR